MIFALSIILSCTLYVTYAAETLCTEMGRYQLAHPLSCSRYYICVNGQRLEQRCSDGLDFDRNEQRCVPRHMTRCQLAVCQTNDIYGRLTMFQDPDSCSRYYACSRGDAITMECAAGLSFNPAISKCDLSGNFHCNNEAEPIQIVEKQVCPNRGIARMAHPTDCKKFYVCMNGVQAQFECTGDLLFDVMSNVCNFPYMSKCANSIE